MLKEQLIQTVDKEYYRRNYCYMYNEIDARITGTKGAYQYLKSLGLENEKILNLQKKDFFEGYKEKQKIEGERYKNAKIKITRDGKRGKVVNTFFNKVIRKNPNLLEEYPVLKLEFNEEGARKPSFEILKNYE